MERRRDNPDDVRVVPAPHDFPEAVVRGIDRRIHVELEPVHLVDDLLYPSLIDSKSSQLECCSTSYESPKGFRVRMSTVLDAGPLFFKECPQISPGEPVKL